MKQNELALLIEGRTAVASGSGQRLRERAGLSQSELARLAGVTPAAVCRWEGGTRTPNEGAAIAYARALRRVEELLRESTGMSDERLVLTIEETARMLGVGRSTAYNAARRGELPTIRLGRRLLVPRARLEELLGAGTAEGKDNGSIRP